MGKPVQIGDYFSRKTELHIPFAIQIAKFVIKIQVKKNVFLEVAEGIRPNPGGEIICLRLEGSKPGRNGGIQNNISVFLSERAQENFQP